MIGQGRGAGSGFFRTWVLWVSVGESVGFLAPALAQMAVAPLGQAATTAALVAAGAIEGTMLGWAQFLVLRRRIPALSAPNWIGGTAAAGSLAWFIGLLPSTYGSVWQAWPAWAVVAFGLTAGAILLCSIGFAQWLELRRHVPRAGRWVPGSAVAWCAGLAVFLVVATPLWQPGQAPQLVILIGVVAGILMATSMAAVSGLVLAGLLSRAREARPSPSPSP